MPSEPSYHRMEKQKYSIVLIPSGDSSKTRSFSFGMLGAVALVILSFFVIVALVVAILVYTPVGRLMPISNVGVEQQYVKQIVDIQSQLNALLHEMIVLQSYNLRLRKALGENVSEGDTASFTTSQVSAPPGTSFVAQNSPEQVSSPQVPESQSRQEELISAGSNQIKSVSPSTEFPLTMPADGYISRGFDAQNKHFGIDIAGKEGSAILAAADGNVVFAGWTYDDGYLMIIAHAQGYTTMYKHNRVLLKSSGSNVKRGDVVALLGNTGKTSSGPHLHFEVWKDGIVLNPDNYLLITQ